MWIMTSRAPPPRARASSIGIEILPQGVQEEARTHYSPVLGVRQKDLCKREVDQDKSFHLGTMKSAYGLYLHSCIQVMIEKMTRQHTVGEERILNEQPGCCDYGDACHLSELNGGASGGGTRTSECSG